MTTSLKLVRTLAPDITPPRVDAEIKIAASSSGESVLRVDFTVRDAKLNAKAKHPKDEPVWGLWDSDVCELFVSTAQNEADVATAPYFEFQVSPFAQYFELKILEPRKKQDEGFRSGVKVGAAVRTTQAWTAFIEVPLKALGLDAAKPLFGSMCACLLRDPQRAYLASAHNPSGPPNFHQPQFFTKLL